MTCCFLNVQYSFNLRTFHLNYFSFRKVTVRCGCHSLKKEWLCHEVQAGYIKSDRDPKDIPRTQYGSGLLPCDSSCKSKAEARESELLQRKPKAPEVIIGCCLALLIYYCSVSFIILLNASCRTANHRITLAR